MIDDEELIRTINRTDVFAVLYNKTELVILKDKKGIYAKRFYLVEIQDFVQEMQLETDIVFRIVNIDKISPKYKLYVENQVEKNNKKYIDSFESR